MDGSLKRKILKRLCLNLIGAKLGMQTLSSTLTSTCKVTMTRPFSMPEPTRKKKSKSKKAQASLQK